MARKKKKRIQEKLQETAQDISWDKSNKKPVEVLKKKNYQAVLIPLFIFLVAFIERLFFLSSNIDKDFPFSIFYYGDSMKYSDYAVALLQGKLYDVGIPYHPPLFAWLLAGIYKIMNIPTGSGYPYKILYSFINSIVCVMLYFLVKEIMKKEYAVIICLIFALSFGMLVISATPNNENIYLLIVVLTLWLLIKYRNLHSYSLFAVIGVLCGIGSLTRAEHLALVPFIILYLIINSKLSIKQSFKYYVFLLLAMFVVVLPWTIRNYSVLSAYNRTKSTPGLEPLSPFVLITNYGAVNFAMANNHYAQGGFTREILTTSGGGDVLNPENPQHRYYFLHGYKEGLSWIMNNPSRYVSLCYKKLNISFDALALGFTSWNFPSGLVGVRRSVDVFAPAKRWLNYPDFWNDPQGVRTGSLTIDFAAPESNWFKYAFLLLFMVGFFLMLAKNAKKYLIFHFFLIHKIIIIILFFGYVRQILSIYPIMILFACYPLIFLKEKILKIGTWLFISIALIACVYDAASTAKPKDYIAAGSFDPHSGYLIQDADLYIQLKK